MAKYKLVVLDMDGTVLDENQQIPERNRQAILDAAAAGVTVMFATGRSIQSAQPYVEQLEMKSPIITVNGGEVWRQLNDLWYRKTLQAEVVRRLRELALEHGTWYWAYAVEGLYNRDRWIEDPDTATWLKFGFFCEDMTVLETIRRELITWERLEISNSHPKNIEINPKGITKAAGLMRICEWMGLDMSQVVAMGDSLNDIPMIRAAGLGVAMGNAQEAVKEAADLVTLTNTEYGVADVIYRYVLS